jgi:membrane associated rhomboid family serine protease
MIPMRASRLHHWAPVVTWTLVLLNVIVYVWDRQGNIFGPSVVFADLTMRPRSVLLSMEGFGDESFPLITLLTSMFMHANLLHLVGNMIYLYVFGGGIEDALGPVRYVLYYLMWGFVASFTHILVDPTSPVPVLGASGAIGGVLGAYFLLFPSSKIKIVVPILIFQIFNISAWVLLGLWFLLQVLIPQEGVANWAHAGGFLAGMLTVLIMGGRTTVLGDRDDEGLPTPPPRMGAPIE